MIPAIAVTGTCLGTVTLVVSGYLLGLAHGSAISMPPRLTGRLLADGVTGAFVGSVMTIGSSGLLVMWGAQ